MSNTNKKSNKGTFITLGIILAILALTVILENTINANSLLFTVIRKGAVYSLVAVSMNLLNGFTGLFSLGQAGFMLLGAYTYAILTIPGNVRDTVYYLFQGSSFNFSFVDSLKSVFGDSGAGGTAALIIGALLAIICAGIDNTLKAIFGIS